jgi:hypothetical protein
MASFSGNGMLDSNLSWAVKTIARTESFPLIFTIVIGLFFLQYLLYIETMMHIVLALLTQKRKKSKTLNLSVNLCHAMNIGVIDVQTMS